MRNTEKSFPRVVAERTLSGILMFAGAGMVVKAADCRQERVYLRQLEVLDQEEAMLKQQADQKIQVLQNSPKAQEIIGECKTKLSKCMDRVGNPFDKECRGLMVDVHSFHNTIAKPREAHFFLNSIPQVYSCDITIQSEMNRCHEKMVDCLDVKKD